MHQETVTFAEFVAEIARAILPAGDDDLLFAEWMAENAGRLEEAMRELGEELPAAGPGLYGRVKAVVLPHLGKNQTYDNAD